jgi:hypothetical protein
MKSMSAISETQLVRSSSAAPFQEVAPGPGTQVLGFADVDDATGSILDQIDAGPLRKLLDFRRSLLKAGFGGQHFVTHSASLAPVRPQPLGSIEDAGAEAIRLVGFG